MQLRRPPLTLYLYGNYNTLITQKLIFRYRNPVTRYQLFCNAVVKAVTNSLGRSMNPTQKDRLTHLIYEAWKLVKQDKNKMNKLASVLITTCTLNISTMWLDSNVFCLGGRNVLMNFVKGRKQSDEIITSVLDDITLSPEIPDSTPVRDMTFFFPVSDPPPPKTGVL